jgi:hypothetical protein
MKRNEIAAARSISGDESKIMYMKWLATAQMA